MDAGLAALLGGLGGGALGGALAITASTFQRRWDRAETNRRTTAAAVAELIAAVSALEIRCTELSVTGPYPGRRTRSLRFAESISNCLEAVIRCHTALYLAAEGELISIANQVLEATNNFVAAVSSPGIRGRRQIASALDALHDSSQRLRTRARLGGGLSALPALGPTSAP